MKKIFLIFILCFVSFNTFSQGITYYSQGSLLANSTSSWNSARNGSGLAPADFISGDFFVIQNGHAMTTSNTLNFSIQGDDCGFTIESGGSIQVNKGISIRDVNNFNETVTLQANSLLIDNTGASNSLKSLFSKAANIFLNPNSTVRIVKDITITNNGFNIQFPNLDLQANLNLSYTGGSAAVRGILSIANSMVFDVETNCFIGTDFFTTSGSGTLRTANTTANPISYNLTWNFPVEFSSNSPQSIPPGTYYKLINSGSGTRTLMDNVNITGYLIVGAGILNIGNNILTFN